MTSLDPIVFIVDDEPAIRNSLRSLCQSVGLHARTSPSAADFLEHYDENQPGCIIIDVRLSGMGGLELQQELAERGSTLPVIMLTGHGDVPMAVRATKAGAQDFLEKPFRAQDILDAIHRALRQNSEVRVQQARRAEIERRMESLTPREREVLDLVVDGNTTKQIALSLSRSAKTIDIHRSNLMHKMRARSVAELVRLALEARAMAIGVNRELHAQVG